jgi:hypothetical protein
MGDTVEINEPANPALAPEAKPVEAAAMAPASPKPMHPQASARPAPPVQRDHRPRAPGPIPSFMPSGRLKRDFRAFRWRRNSSKPSLRLTWRA